MFPEWPRQCSRDTPRRGDTLEVNAVYAWRQPTRRRQAHNRWVEGACPHAEQGCSENSCTSPGSAPILRRVRCRTIASRAVSGKVLCLDGLNAVQALDQNRPKKTRLNRSGSSRRIDSKRTWLRQRPRESPEPSPPGKMIPVRRPLSPEALGRRIDLPGIGGLLLHARAVACRESRHRVPHLRA